MVILAHRWRIVASMDTRQVVAANVRARLAFMDLGYGDLMALGWKRRTIANRLRGIIGFTAEELAQLAELFGLEDPGVLFRVPEGFAPAAEPVRSSARGLLPSTKEQLGWSGYVRPTLDLAQKRVA